MITSRTLAGKCHFGYALGVQFGAQMAISAFAAATTFYGVIHDQNGVSFRRFNSGANLRLARGTPTNSM
jgi:hypothetical protein